MGERMISLPPYLGTLEWYARLADRRLRGEDGFPEAERKQYSRTGIRGHGEPMTLSVPIAGGASAVKRLAPDKLEVSMHGRWTHQHLGAIEAVYGRTPFFIHLFPGLSAIIETPPLSLPDLNLSLHNLIWQWMRMEDIVSAATAREIRSSQAVARRGRELAAVLDFRLSVIDAAFRIGPEAVLALPFADT